MLYVIQIDSRGIPGQLTAVHSFDAGIDLLARLASEQGVTVDRDTLTDENGFFVNSDSNDATGCWLIMSEKP
jgi:hypothetical protein